MTYELEMNIVFEKEGDFIITVTESDSVTHIAFNPETKTLKFPENNNVTDLLKANEYQLRKLLHNKKKETFYPGFHLFFSLIDQKDIAAYNNRHNLIALENGKTKVVPYDKRESLKEIFTDGSYNEQTQQGAFSLLAKDLNGNYLETVHKTESTSSSLIELEAVILALTTYEGNLRIVTDSLYVRKGITEWIVHWKRNDWMTANGTKAKNISQWQLLDQLCQNRYIEFMWIKAHNKHFENEYCDLIAKEETKR